MCIPILVELNGSVSGVILNAEGSLVVITSAAIPIHEALLRPTVRGRDEFGVPDVPVERCRAVLPVSAS